MELRGFVFTHDGIVLSAVFPRRRNEVILIATKFDANGNLKGNPVIFGPRGQRLNGKRQTTLESW